MVVENNYTLPRLNLNQTTNYFLLEKLKPSTNYSLCLQANDQYLCRTITTVKQQQTIALSSKSIESASPSVLVEIDYLIVAISLGIVLILVILAFLLLFSMKQRGNLNLSSKTTSMESYYQTGGSDTTHIGICHQHASDDRSTHTLHYPSTPILCYCQMPSTCIQEQQPYHVYHEIPFYKPPLIV